MNILLLTSHFNPGGVTTYCLVLCRYLANDGHRMIVASGGGACVKELESLGIKHYQVPINTSSELNPKLFRAYRQLKKIIADENIQVIHAQSRVTQVLSYFLSRVRPVRRVFTCHGFFKRRLFRALFPLWGDRVIAISRPVADHLSDDWNVSVNDIVMVPHGIEPYKTRAEKALNTKSRADQILIGTFGRFSSVKGYHILIEAMAHLKQKSLNIKLVLVGQGSEQQSLQRQVRQLRLSDDIRFETKADQFESTLSSLDIFCAPSLQEGLGLSILEAMQRGMPIVASNVGGIPELIKHEETGLLVSPGSALDLANALDRLVSNPELRYRLGKQAKRYVEKSFPLKRMIDETRMVYDTAGVS
jgi:glycosyltransferase involved in cell wall biosynthesis